MFVTEFLPLCKTGDKTIKFKFYLILSFFLNISYFSFYAADHSQTNEAILKTVLQNAARGKDYKYSWVSLLEILHYTSKLQPSSSYDKKYVQMSVIGPTMLQT